MGSVSGALEEVEVVGITVGTFGSWLAIQSEKKMVDSKTRGQTVASKTRLVLNGMAATFFLFFWVKKE